MNGIELNIAILQFGRAYETTSFNLDGNLKDFSFKKLFATFSLFPNLKKYSPHLTIGAGAARLIISSQWQGYLSSTRGYKYIKKQPHGSSTIRYDLLNNDSLCLYLDEWQILMKIRSKNAFTPKSNSAPSEQESLVLAHFRTPFWIRASAAGGSLALILLILTLFFCIPAPQRKATFALTSGQQTLLSMPFIDPSQFELAPELLKYDLKREDYVASLRQYYQSLIEMRLGKSPPRTGNLYAQTQLLADTRHQAELSSQKQYSDEIQQKNERLFKRKDQALLVVPARLTEDLHTSTQRLLKMTQRQLAFLPELKESRLQVAKDFSEDPDYDWFDYKNSNIAERQSSGNAAIDRVHVFKGITGEELMYLEAQNLANQARITQAYFNRFTQPSPAGVKVQFVLPASVPGLSFGYSMKDQGPLRRLSSLASSALIEDKGDMQIREPLIGSTDRASIRRTVESHKYDIVYCYSQLLEKFPKVRGEQQWAWNINSSGMVWAASLVRASLKDADLTRCIESKIRSWHFIPSKNGSVRIVHTFHFEPIEDSLDFKTF